MDKLNFYSSTESLRNHVISLIERGNNKFIMFLKEKKFPKPRDIQELKREGWKLKVVDFFGDTTDFGKKEILIQKETYNLITPIHELEACSIEESKSPALHRDRVICHEIVHALYGEISMDGFLFRKAVYLDNAIIVEYLARQIRTKPELLSTILAEFSLKPLIYDKSSFEAYHQLTKQTYFKFLSELYLDTIL